MIGVIIANSGTIPEIVALRLNAPRKNINGSLYMGDTVEIELISTKTGLTEAPRVIISYEEWNSNRDAVISNTKTITLNETEAGSKRHTAEFKLPEGICKIVVLSGELAPDIKTVNINTKVAGRLKAVVEEPAVVLDDEQKTIYNDILSNSFVMVKSEENNDYFTSNRIKSDAFIIEGLDEATDYVLTHYDLDNIVIFQQDINAHVKSGLETELSYRLEKLPSHLKVKVVDDITGQMIENVRITSNTLSFTNDKSSLVSAVTGKDGYASTRGSYFSKNVIMNSRIVLTTKFQSISNKIADWYGNKTVTLDPLALGDNEIVIRLTKAKIVTLEGTVKDHKGVPLKDVYVSISQSIGNSPFTNTSSTTDDDGRYSMSLSNIGGTVSFSIDDNLTRETVELTEDINILDKTITTTKPSTVKVVIETMDQNGVITQMDVDQSVNSGMNISVKNNSNQIKGNLKGYYYPSIYNIKGNPGDTIEVAADGYQYGYGKGSATAVLDDKNYAQVKMVLKQLGRVNANVTDQSGNEKSGEYRHIYI
jgi:uncharacterized FlaG/YvyC family protein